MITREQRKRLEKARIPVKQPLPPLLRVSAKKLCKVRASILKEAALYDQASCPEIFYFDDDDNNEIDVIKTACGTPACMVGWLMWEEAQGKPKQYVEMLREFGGSEEGFIEILGITSEEAMDLYAGGFSDEEWARAAKDNPGFRPLRNSPAQQAMLGAARIDLFIERHRLI